MNFQGNFLHLGNIDTTQLKALVLELTDADWTQDNTRQKRYEVHKDTQFIGLVFDEDFRHMNATRRPALRKFEKALRPTFELIAEHYENSPEFFEKFRKKIKGYFVRVSLAKLLSQGHIFEHQDMNFSLSHSHRIHIPIITNEDVTFNVGHESVNLKEGEVVEINNRRVHSVSNKSGEDRVHLIVDWVFPWEPCCCQQKLHPRTPCNPDACLASDRLQIPCNCRPESEDTSHSLSKVSIEMEFDLKSEAEKATELLSDEDVVNLLRQPSIILSAPRAGSTLLFEQMSKFEHFWTIGEESHIIFRAFPHLRAQNAQLDSMSLGEMHADDETCNVFRRCFLYLLRNSAGVPYLSLPPEQRPKTLNLLEKTPRNALNIPFLLKVFPDTKFIYLHRDPRQSVSSLIEAWSAGLRTGRFVTFDDLPDWPLPAWCFILPPGWRKLKGRPGAEIAAFQWLESNKAIVQGLMELPADRWTSVKYSNFVSSPARELDRINNDLGFACDPISFPEDGLELSRTTITPPNPDKWRRHEKDIGILWNVLAEAKARIEAFTKSH